VVIIIESYNQQHPKAGVGSAPNHNKQKSISRCARILIRPNCSYGPCCPSPVPRKGRAGLCCAAVWHVCEARASAPAFMPPNCPRVRQSQACVARAQCLCLHATHSCCWDQQVQIRPPAIQSIPGKHGFKLMQPWPQRTQGAGVRTGITRNLRADHLQSSPFLASMASSSCNPGPSGPGCRCKDWNRRGPERTSQTQTAQTEITQPPRGAPFGAWLTNNWCSP
jgi:hypothetical protein